MCIRVELLDGNYTLVPEAAEEGADEELNFVDVHQDFEEPPTNCASEGKPRSIT
jgi:CO dehydrogenase/acetyl-CoA synthase beta subunit